jgi:hypothetical protein
VTTSDLFGRHGRAQKKADRATKAFSKAADLLLQVAERHRSTADEAYQQSTVLGALAADATRAAVNAETKAEKIRELFS